MHLCNTPLTIPHESIGPPNTGGPMAAGSVLVELFDSSDSIEDRLLKYTLAGGRLKEALRSRKQEKKVKNVRATGPNLN